MIMNANDLELPKGQFDGPPERKWTEIHEGQARGLLIFSAGRFLNLHLTSLYL